MLTRAGARFLGSPFPPRSRPGWPASGSGNSPVPWSKKGWLDAGSFIFPEYILIFGSVGGEATPMSPNATLSKQPEYQGGFEASSTLQIEQFPEVILKVQLSLGGSGND